MTNRRKLTTENNNDVGPLKKMQRLAFPLAVPQIPTLSGTALVCGMGEMGQLGLGEDQMEKKRPTLLPSLEKVVYVVAGGMHNLCLMETGDLYSFGCNDEGALGRDTTEEGSEFEPKMVTLPGKVVKISAGDSHSACLLADGRVFAWGSFRDSHGNMGLTMEGNKRLPVEIMTGIKSCDIASGADHLVILTCYGKVYTIGCGEQGQLGRVSLRSASGESRRGKSELLRPSMVITKGRKPIDAIWATTYCSFLREAASKIIWAFGLNNFKQLAYLKDIQVVISPIKTHFENILKIAGGQHHTLILTQDHKCFVVGRRDYGRLGIGDLNEDVQKLTLITTLADLNIVDISCGEAQSFALTEEGKLYAWGMGSSLQLGTGLEDDALVPTLIESKQIVNKKIIQVGSGGQHSIFLAIDKSPKTTEIKTNDDIQENVVSKPIRKNVKPEVVLKNVKPELVRKNVDQESVRKNADKESGRKNVDKDSLSQPPAKKSKAK